MYALLQRLDDEVARQVWSEVASLEGPFVKHPGPPHVFAAIPARIALERKNWLEASRLRTRWPSTIPWDVYPQMEAVTEFARGLGAARTGDIEAAETAVARLVALQAPASAFPGHTAFALSPAPVPDQSIAAFPGLYNRYYVN